FEGKVLVLYGDTPALRTESLRDLVAACPKGGVSFLVAEIDDPASYGRIVRDAAGRFVGIKEERDASAAERAIREVNLGAYAFDGPRLFSELADVLAAPRKNEKAEYYLTDVVGRFEKADVEVAIRRTTDPDAWLGINSPRDLARVRRVLQDRILARHLARGVRIVDPATTYVDWDVDIGEGTVLYPCTVVGRGARIGPNCEVGPFAHLRTDAVLREGAIVGNYVEVKKAVLGAGAKARHLTYLGDAEVGAGANVGAGTITANWDGRTKHKTTIEEGAFVGSGTVFVAPATLGKGARTGAGAIVTKGTRVPDGETWVGVPARPLPQKAGRAGNSNKEGARPGAGEPPRSGALAPGKGDDGARG
ncbi:MAG TPA: bifunctional UDP-N-acetylglucosamine diphosphorylase/glucosamine-1-phosphate N-acetyltransferase GlmU, partial [Planctomycetota bacterium]|nr:bifunctional UDP-N-acetylglucosamine diphosphorylase/glucosamine-1-phosphate N-acetyltransferase GlmU [Planctomycetota bacterium]